MYALSPWKYFLKSYGLDFISCTGFVRVTGYKSLLLAAHAITALLAFRHGVGGGGWKWSSSSWSQYQRGGGGGGLKRGGRRNRLEIRGVGWRVHIQGGGGDTSMITYSAERCPSDPALCLFEWLFYAFLNDCMLSFDAILIRNELYPLMFSHHCFRSPKRLFFLAWITGDAIGST